MVNQSVRTITAHSLLHGFLRLRRLTPEMGEWSEERLSLNPPRLYRLRQLIALFRAFEIAWDPSSFVEGRFIQPANPRYMALVERMYWAMSQTTRGHLGAANHELRDCFEILLGYRGRLEDVLSFSSGILEASGLYLYAHRKVGELNKIIQDNVALIDDILVAFISPEAKVFPIDQLVRDYGYPDVDLFEIDAEWS